MRTAPIALAISVVSVALSAQSVVQTWPVSYANAFVGGVGLDHVADTVWVADETNLLITQFSRTGTQLTQFPPPTVPGIASPLPIGIKVHPVTGNLWVVDEAEVVYEMTRTGTLVSSFSVRPAITDASAIAIDVARQRIWVSNDSARLLGEFDLTGTSITTVSVSGAGSQDPDGLAYNPINDHLYLGEDTGDQILEVDRTGTLVMAYPTASLGISPEGIDVDTRSGTMFIGGGFAQRAVFEVAGILTAGPGTAATYGAGCMDSGGTVPVLNVSKAPNIGGQVVIGLQGSTSLQTFGWFVIGTTRAPIPLGFIGAPNCTLHNDPLALTPPVGTNVGRAALVINYPATLVPATYNFTGFFLPDGTANNIGISGSNGLELTFQ